MEALHHMKPLPFGQLGDGREAKLHTLKSAGGLVVRLADLGGIVVSVEVPDRTGVMADVALGFNSAKEYLELSPYFGAIVGRVANRISGGRFSLDGKSYQLACNNVPNGVPCHLHGGTVGFDKVLWQAEPATLNGDPALRLSYRSRDGEEGYPGNVTIDAVYSLTQDNGLRLDFSASTDAPTPLNLANHSYFNLKGEGEGDILDHEIEIPAQRFTPVNLGLIPTGERRDVRGTPFDFTSAQRIGQRIDADDEQLRLAGGYDHNFVIDGDAGTLRRAALVHERTSGRTLEVLTTEPGMQFYSGNFLDGTLHGKTGRVYAYRGGLALETQHFPDSVNHPDFPNTLLRPGETFRSTTIYRFSAR